MSRRRSERPGKAARPRTPETGKAGSRTASLRDGTDWSPASPGIASDMRRMDRISQRELGRVAVSLRTPSGTWLAVRLWDFTSIGLGVVHEPTGEGMEPILARSAAIPPVKPDDEVELRLEFPAHGAFRIWCKVMNRAPWRGGTKIGLRRLDMNFPQQIGSERRRSDRLALPPALALKARIPHPFLLGHWSHLRVTDVNRSLGFAFESSDPSILLFEGMTVAVHFDLPSPRGLPMLARVAWVFATGADSVRFGVECLEMDWRLQEGICDLLLLTRNWTPKKLREAGFRSSHVKERLRFRTVRTMEDYAEVLGLRRDAYVGAGKRFPATALEDMASHLDGTSRILTARHHGRLVGTMTFTFPANEDDLLDSQEGFPGRKYPVALPPKTNLIEVSRLCIDEQYRGTDLLIGMFEHGVKHFLLSDRHWLLTSATAELLPSFEKIGFTRLKASYRHPFLNHQEHHLIIAHRSAFLWGWGIGPLTWNSVFGELVSHLLRHRLLALPAWTRAVIRAKLLLGPLARSLSDAKARKAFRMHLRAIRSRRVSGSRPQEESGRIPGESEATEWADAGGGSLYSTAEIDPPGPPGTRTGA